MIYCYIQFQVDVEKYRPYLTLFLRLLDSKSSVFCSNKMLGTIKRNYILRLKTVIRKLPHTVYDNFSFVVYFLALATDTCSQQTYSTHDQTR